MPKVGSASDNVERNDDDRPALHSISIDSTLSPLMRLRTDIWVSAYLRRCAVEGAQAVLRKRGAPEAGAVFVKIDRLDGTLALFGPAPQSVWESGEQGFERRFVPFRLAPGQEAADAEVRLKREMAFDPDLWIVEVEDRQGRHFLDLVSVGRPL